MPTYFHFHVPHANLAFDHKVTTDQCAYVNPETGRQCRNRVTIGLPLCWVHRVLKLHLMVRPSLIPGAGRGVFVHDTSARPGQPVFTTGQKICDYDGEIITQQELVRRYGEYTAPYGLMLLSGRTKDHTNPGPKTLYEDAGTHLGIGSLINHQEKGVQILVNNRQHENARLKTTVEAVNCEFVVPKRGAGAYIRATRPIYEGEELYLHYGEDYQFEEPGVTYTYNQSSRGVPPPPPPPVVPPPPPPPHVPPPPVVPPVLPMAPPPKASRVQASRSRRRGGWGEWGRGGGGEWGKGEWDGSKWSKLSKGGGGGRGRWRSSRRSSRRRHFY